MITNLRYADDIILLDTSEAELQELVDRLDRVSHKYSLLINVDKTKVMASDTIRYDTRCYFNVRSKADISQLNLPHGTDN